jgi:hypothetical protein
VTELSSLAERSWLALHALPRVNNYGDPPSYRSLERRFDLPPSVFSKLFAGERHSVDTPTLQKLATALRVSVEWLATGVGQPPEPTGPVPTRMIRDGQRGARDRSQPARRISDPELVALSGLVQAHAGEVMAANADRLSRDEALAYPSFWPCAAAEVIERELRARGVL